MHCSPSLVIRAVSCSFTWYRVCEMANLLPAYVGDLTLAFSRRSSQQLEGLVPLQPAHQAYRPLQNALQSVRPIVQAVDHDWADLNTQVPVSGLTTSFIAPVVSTLSSDTRDNFASFVVALLKYIRLPDAGDFEAVHAKFAALVTTYTYVDPVPRWSVWS